MGINSINDDNDKITYGSGFVFGSPLHFHTYPYYKRQNHLDELVLEVKQRKDKLQMKPIQVVKKKKRKCLRVDMSTLKVTGRYFFINRGGGGGGYPTPTTDGFRSTQVKTRLCLPT